MQEHLDGNDVKKIMAGDYVPKRPAAQSVRKFKGRDNTKYGKRHIPGQMNKTEESFAEGLAFKMLRGEIVRWCFESITFKLADDCRYTPDFAIVHNDGSMEFVDAKGAGPIDPKSLVKIKCAAEKFPQFAFVIEQRKNKRDGGGWKRTEF